MMPSHLLRSVHHSERTSNQGYLAHSLIAFARIDTNKPTKNLLESQPISPVEMVAFLKGIFAAANKCRQRTGGRYDYHTS